VTAIAQAMELLSRTAKQEPPHPRRIPTRSDRVRVTELEAETEAKSDRIGELEGEARTKDAEIMRLQALAGRWQASSDAYYEGACLILAAYATIAKKVARRNKAPRAAERADAMLADAERKLAEVRAGRSRGKVDR